MRIRKRSMSSTATTVTSISNAHAAYAICVFNSPGREISRLIATGKAVRVYVPYGSDWYGYFTRRLAERPANLLFFLRSLASKG